MAVDLRLAQLFQVHEQNAGIHVGAAVNTDGFFHIIRELGHVGYRTVGARADKVVTDVGVVKLGKVARQHNVTVDVYSLVIFGEHDGN